MVEDLTRMTMERLYLYKKKNGKLPDRIMVFRDGVSEVSFSSHHCWHALHVRLNPN